jgi:hypothetical protein
MEEAPMKLHLKRMSNVSLNAARTLSVLAVAALTASALLLGSAPIHAAPALPVTLQCQVGTNSNGYTLGCSGQTPDGSVTLRCTSPDPINISNGKLVAIAATCDGNVVVAGTTVAETLAASLLSINANDGTITASSGGTSSLSINNGLASVTVVNTGDLLQSLFPLEISFTNGTASARIDVLGIGTAQVDGQGSGSVSFANLAFTINSLDITASASVLDLITADAACGSSVILNLNQLFPIIVPLVSCKAL